MKWDSSHFSKTLMHKVLPTCDRGVNVCFGEHDDCDHYYELTLKPEYEMCLCKCVCDHYHQYNNEILAVIFSTAL